MLRRMLKFVDHGRIDAVQHARNDGSGGLPDDPEDGDGDKQADDGIGQRVAQPDARRPEDDGEAGDPVRAGVESVRDQGGAVHLTPDANTEHRHGLVADEADNAGHGQPAELLHRLRMQQARDRLVAGHHGAEQDDKDDEDAGQVLCPAKAVGEGSGRLAPCQHEGDP